MNISTFTHQVEQNKTHIPDTILIDMVRTGKIPTLPIKWLDERIGCRYARRDNLAGAATCPMLHKGNQPWCRLNGEERKTPCVFAEPEEAEVWQRIREQQAYDRETIPDDG